MKEQVNRKINAGIACSDRANEVEPRPNEEIRTKQSLPFTVIASAAKQSLPKNALIVRDWLRRAPLRFGCHVAALLAMTISIVTKILFTQPLRRYVFNPANLVNPINHGSDNMLDCFAALAMTVGGCFAKPVPNKVWGRAMTALFKRLPASAHFQFSPVRAAELIFNFQLDKAEATENPQPKSRYKLKFKK
jgi:hypothetical protein